MIVFKLQQSPLSARLAAPLIGEPSLAGAPLVNADARRWIALAVGSLVLAGLLSLAVVLGRLPFLSGFIDDPLFFKRCLVAHVDLSLLVWFYAFIAGLLSLSHRNGYGLVGRLTFSLSALGVAAMLGGALAKGAEPLMSNYIPVIDHPLFLSGLALFFAGVVGFFMAALGQGAGPGEGGGVLPVSTQVGLKAAALCVVLAAVTCSSAIAGLPRGLDRTSFFEFSFWGAGHVLQVANVCGMLAVWCWVLQRLNGRQPLSKKGAALLFGGLIAPHFSLPLLTARGTLDGLYHSGATQLMRWGIFPAVIAALVVGLFHLRRHGFGGRTRAGRALASGLGASVALTALGIILGACIRNSTTMVPAHYHASLGGVTVSFMTAAYLVVSLSRGKRKAGRTGDPAFRWAGWQLLLFGVGQSIFVAGFAIGGVYGLGRKTYAAEQQVRSVGEHVGLAIMGVGGLVAVAGGLWFLCFMLREMRGWWTSRRSCGYIEQTFR